MNGNIIKTANTYNHTFTQQVKPAYSMISGKPCSGVQMIYLEAREKVNQLSH